MLAKAYVLIGTAADRTSAVAEALRHIPGVVAADLVTGPYDIIAIVQGPDSNAVGKIILNDIRGLQGVTSTLTCLTLQPSASS
jgi:DNA-binding Lrp family transcriptional regulator